MQAPKYMAWYAAFGLMVRLLWLYARSCDYSPRSETDKCISKSACYYKISISSSRTSTTA